MSQKDRVESWKDSIIDILSKYDAIRVPEITMFTYIGLRKDEAEAIALENNLILKFLENRVNDFPGIFQFGKKEKEE